MGLILFSIIYISPPDPPALAGEQEGPGQSWSRAWRGGGSASALQLQFLLLLFELCAGQELNLQRLLITRTFYDVERQSWSFSPET